MLTTQAQKKTSLFAVCIFLFTLGSFWFWRAEEPDRLEPLRHGSVAIFDCEEPLATVLVVHSVYQDKETTYPICRSLRQSGFTTVAVHLDAGHDFSAYLKTLGKVVEQSKDSGPVYLVGHSMGADLASNLAVNEKRVAKLCCLGFPAEISLLDIPVFIGAGVWDQVHSPQELLLAAGSSENSFSSTCDHSQETLDPQLQRSIVDFLGGESRIVVGNRVLGLGLVFWSAFWMAFLLLPCGPKKTLVSSYFAAIFFIIVSGSAFATGCGLALYLASCVRSARSESELSFFKEASKQFLLLAFAVALSWSANAYQSILSQPDVLLGLPVAICSWPVILAARLCNGVHGLGILGIIIFLTVLFVSEYLRPGLWSRSLLKYLAKLKRRVSQFNAPKLEKPSLPQLSILLALLILGAFLWYRTSQAGYSLESEELVALFKKFALLLLAPLGLYLLGQRYVD